MGYEYKGRTVTFFRRTGYNGKYSNKQPKWHMSTQRMFKDLRTYNAVCSYEYDAILGGVMTKKVIVNPDILCTKCVNRYARARNPYRFMCDGSRMEEVVYLDNFRLFLAAHNRLGKDFGHETSYVHTIKCGHCEVSMTSESGAATEYLTFMREHDLDVPHAEIWNPDRMEEILEDKEKRQ